MMRVNYVGKFTVANGNSCRLAEINITEEEEEKLRRIMHLMKIKGWNIEYSVQCWACCEVEDKEEYKEFMEDWKESKHCITQCMKYGF